MSVTAFVVRAIFAAHIVLFASVANAASSPSDHDSQLMADMSECSAAWNVAVGPIMRGYVDPNVAAEDWVKTADKGSIELKKILARMTVAHASFNESRWRDMYGPLVKNYGDKLSALKELHRAVAQGDETAEMSAQAHLGDVARKGTELATTMLEELSKHMDPAVIEAIVAGRIKDAPRNPAAGAPR